MKIGEKIKQERTKRKMTQAELAKLIGTTPQNIYKYENGIVTNIPIKSIEKLSSIFNISPACLSGWVDDNDNILPLQVKKIPLLGNIACGTPIYATEQYDMYVNGGDIRADFCLIAKGDSMIGARIYDGDIVFVRKQECVEDGEIAAVLIGEEATLKRVRYDMERGELSLFPENPQYKTMHFSGEELNDVKILGKAVAFQSALA